MTAYERGFMDKCAELGVNPRWLLKAAGPLGEYSFDIEDSTSSSGNGLATRSVEHDYNDIPLAKDYKGVTHYPGPDRGTATIQRLRQPDGSVRYKVTRYFGTPNRDASKRFIDTAISVDVDSPYKAMRLAKGKIELDAGTKTLLDSVQRSTNGRLLSKGAPEIAGSTRFELPKRFGIHVTDPGISKSIKEVRRMTVNAHRINPYKLLRRLARLHPGKAKLVAGGAMAVPAVGSALYAMLHKRRK